MALYEGSFPLTDIIRKIKTNSQLPMTMKERSQRANRNWMKLYDSAGKRRWLRRNWFWFYTHLIGLKSCALYLYQPQSKMGKTSTIQHCFSHTIENCSNWISRYLPLCTVSSLSRSSCKSRQERAGWYLLPFCRLNRSVCWERPSKTFFISGCWRKGS